MGKLDPKVKARMKRKQRIRHIYAQLIDDASGSTVIAASTLDPSVREKGAFENKIAAATHIGKLVAERALEKGIDKVVFDRNGFLYHGRVKALSDGAREAGLKF
jgi:large subunit ribosomal protein L18